MAMRRPRIKPTALLTSKRKSRDAKAEKSAAIPNESVAIAKPGEAQCASEINELIENNTVPEGNILVQKSAEVSGSAADDDNNEVFLPSQQLEEQTTTTENAELHTDPTTINESVASSVQQEDTSVSTAECENVPSESAEVDNGSFKCPARVEYSRSYNQMLSSHIDDSYHTDLEDSVLQSDLQKSANGFPMSPSRAQVRQRIRPVPVFQRRNSYIGSSSFSQTTDDIIATSMEVPPAVTQRRERHHSASISQMPVSATATGLGTHHHHTPHKFTPTMSLGRVRTESSCSAFSDSYLVPSKMRKTEEHNHRSHTRRDYEARFNNGTPDKSSLKMFDLIYYNPVTNPMEQKPTVSAIKTETKPLEQETKVESKANVDAVANAMPVPQLKLNSNGELILDDTSLEIETTAEQEARKVLANSSLIVLDENTGMNGFYKRRKRTKEWPPEETIKFYRCLQIVGTDFSVMCKLFPKRTRRDLKLKFKKEERHNLALINKALLYPKIFNIDELKEQLDAEEREREEAEKRWKEIKAKDAKPIKKMNIKGSVAARILKNGDDVYQNENIVKRKLSKRAKVADSKKKDDGGKKATTNSNESQPTATESTTKCIENVPETQPNNELIKTEALGNIYTTNTASTSMPIKVENIKSEQHLMAEKANYNAESLQLEDELCDLLDSGDVEEDQGYTGINTKNSVPSQEEDLGQNYETNKTLVDLDNGTVNVVSDDTLSVNTDTTDVSTQRRELDEIDIQRILTELADGTLVLVSTLDPDNADKVVNEIYMLDKTTGELCDTPLDIPEAIVQGILSVMS